MGLPDVIGGGTELLLLIFVGFGAGVLSGFAGVGGAFVVTPALIVIGFPANLAVGTGIAWVVGKSVVAVWGHGKMGNIDVKMGVVMLTGSTIGMEGGVRLLNWAKSLGMADGVVLSISLVMLTTVGTFTLIECFRRKKELDVLIKKNEKLPTAVKTGISEKLQAIKLPPVMYFKKSNLSISLWILVGIGLFVGMLAGLMGVGGGFIMVPSMVYLVGIPSFIAVGTDLFQILFSASYGAIRHSLSGNVVIFAAFIMVIASSIGVQYGILVTRYVRGLSVRYILGISIILCACGVVFKLVGIFVEPVKALFEKISLGITFGSLWLTVMMILGLFILALRYRRGRAIPGWSVAFVASDTENNTLD